MPDVVAHHLAHDAQRPPGGVQDSGLGQPGQPLQQLRRELEAHVHEGGVELPRGGGAFADGPLGDGKAMGVPDDQRFGTLRHSGMIAEVCEPAHGSFPYAARSRTLYAARSRTLYAARSRTLYAAQSGTPYAARFARVPLRPRVRLQPAPRVREEAV